jgi:hypothetical protein
VGENIPKEFTHPQQVLPGAKVTWKLEMTLRSIALFPLFGHSQVWRYSLRA